MAHARKRKVDIPDDRSVSRRRMSAADVPGILALSACLVVLVTGAKRCSTFPNLVVFAFPEGAKGGTTLSPFGSITRGLLES